MKIEPVATVAEVHMSRYTLEWTNGPIPEGSKLYTHPAPTQPAQKPDLWKTQFLTDVMTSAGLLMHGRTDKKLAQRIADGSARWRTELYASAPTQPAQEPFKWYDGAPPFPQNQESFIALTIYGERVVLSVLPEEHTYDYTTADSTYMKAENIKKWMQFPDCEFLPPEPAPTQPAPDLTQDLAMMIRRLALSVRRIAEDDSKDLSFANSCLSWLRDKGLAGSPLREDQPPTQPALSDDEIWQFWCNRPEVPEGEDDSMEAEFVAACKRAIEAHCRGGAKS